MNRPRHITPECKTCQAKPGSPCRDKDGRVSTTIHRSRLL